MGTSRHPRSLISIHMHATARIHSLSDSLTQKPSRLTITQQPPIRTFAHSHAQ